MWADLTTDRLPWCQFRALLVSLPPESAFVRAQSGETGLPLDTQLLAMAVDALHLWLWANSDEKRRGKQPEPVLGVTGRANPDLDRRLLEQRERTRRG